MNGFLSSLAGRTLALGLLALAIMSLDTAANLTIDLRASAITGPGSVSTDGKTAFVAAGDVITLQIWAQSTTTSGTGEFGIQSLQGSIKTTGGSLTGVTGTMSTATNLAPYGVSSRAGVVGELTTPSDNSPDLGSNSTTPVNNIPLFRADPTDVSGFLASAVRFQTPTTNNGSLVSGSNYRAVTVGAQSGYEFLLGTATFTIGAANFGTSMSLNWVIPGFTTPANKGTIAQWLQGSVKADGNTNNAEMFVGSPIQLAALLGWLPTGGGSWSLSANWLGGVPDAQGADAAFVSSILGPSTVTLDGNKTVGSITFANANAYTIAPGSGGTLFLDVTSGNAQVTVSQGSHAISAPLSLTDSANVTVSNGGDVLTVSGPISGAGGINKLGTGSLVLSGSNSYGGGTIISSGTLTTGNASALGTGPVTVNATLDMSGGNLATDGVTIAGGTIRNGTLTATSLTSTGGVVSANLSGTGGLTHNGGLLVLSGSNSYGGGTIISSGTLTTGNASALGTGPVTVNATLDMSGGNLATDGVTISGGTIQNGTLTGASFTSTGGVVSANLSGTGGLIHNGGLLVLSGSNSYGGGTTISSGTLTTGNASALGTGPVTVNATLDIGGGNLVTDGVTIAGGTIQNGTLTGASFASTGGLVSANLSGTGGLVHNSGLLVLSGSNSYGGGTTISSGTLTTGNASALGTGPVTVNATLDMSGGNLATDGVTIAGGTIQNGTLTGASFTSTGGTVSASLSGTGGLVHNGGLLVLSGSNSYGGGTTISSGILTTANARALGTGPVTVNATLDMGGGNLAAGGVTIAGGTIQNGTLTGASFTSTGGTVSASLSGTGGLAHNGGILILSGSNGYGGGTTISGGSLRVNADGALGSVAAGTTVTNGASFELNNTTYNTRETLILNGSGAGNIGALSNSGTSSFAGAITVSSNARISAGGDGNRLTLTGGINKNGTTLTIGGGGTVVLRGIGISGAAANSDLVIDNSTLVLGTSSNYNGATTVQNNGVLKLEAANALTVSPPTALTLNNGGSLDLGGFDGTIASLAGDTTGVITNSAASTLCTLTVSGSTNATLSGSALQDGNGRVGLVKSGVSRLTLTGSSTYSGGTVLKAGILNVVSDSNLGAVPAAPATSITFNPGAGNTATLQMGSDLVLSGNRSILLSSGTAVFDTQTNSTVVSGSISGTGSLFKTGAGVLSLSASNTYTGTTVINAGNLLVGKAGTLGSSGTITFSGGSLQYGAGVTTDYSLRIRNSVSPIAIDTNGQSITYNSALNSSNTGGFAKLGTGTLTFYGSNTYTGTTFLNGGTLRLGSANAFTGGGAITFGGGALQYYSAVVDYSARILSSGSAIAIDVGYGVSAIYNSSLDSSNTGGLTKLGTGTLRLNAANSYAGVTTVTSGTLVLGHATNTLADSSSININGGMLDLGANSDTVGSVTLTSGNLNGGTGTLTGTSFEMQSGVASANLAGAGAALTKSTGGTVTLSGSNAYTGTTFVNGGILNLGSLNALAGGGTIAFGGGSVRYSTSNQQDYSSRIHNSGNAITIDTYGLSITYNFPLDSSNTGGLTKLGTGTLRLSAANSYTGVTTVNSGTLVLGHATNTLADSSSININGGILELAANSDTVGSVTVTSGSLIGSTGALTATSFEMQSGVASANLAGTGAALTKSTSGTITLSGSNSYTGGTTVNAGTLKIQNSAALPTGKRVAVNSAGLLDATSVSNLIIDGLDDGSTGGGSLTLGPAASLTMGAENGNGIFSGSISGTLASLKKTGSGDQTLSGNNTYTGPTTVNGGRLIIAGQSASSSFLADTGGRLRIDGGTLNLGPGSLRANADGAIEYGNSTVNGGFLRGTGTHTILPSSTANFTGVTSYNSTKLVQNGLTYLANFTNGGQITNGATLNWDGGVNTSSGQLTVNNTVNVQDWSNDGFVTINNGGVLNNAGSNLVSGGGSQIKLMNGGQLNLQAGTSLDLHGSLLVNNGEMDGLLNVYYGATAKGGGVFGSVAVYDGGKFSPGNSPGTATLNGSFTWGAGGSTDFELDDATGTAGISPGWDLTRLIGVNGLLSITSGTTSNTQFTIRIASNDVNNTLPALHFDNSLSYKWLMVETSQGITGFDTAAINIDSTKFVNPLNGGVFSVSAEGNNVYVNYSPNPVPEPSGLALLGAGFLSLLSWRKRTR